MNVQRTVPHSDEAAEEEGRPDLVALQDLEQLAVLRIAVVDADDQALRRKSREVALKKSFDQLRERDQRVTARQELEVAGESESERQK